MLEVQLRYNKIEDVLADADLPVEDRKIFHSLYGQIIDCLYSKGLFQPEQLPECTSMYLVNRFIKDYYKKYDEVQ